MFLLHITVILSCFPLENLKFWSQFYIIQNSLKQRRTVAELSIGFFLG